MKEMVVEKVVGWGIFKIDGRCWVWVESEDGKPVLANWGDGEIGEVVEIEKVVRDGYGNPTSFFVVESC